MKKLFILLGLSLFLIAGTSISKELVSPEMEKAQWEAEQNIRPFNPLFHLDPTRQHAVIFFELEGNKLTLDDSKISIRPGLMPRKFDEGENQIVFLDGKNAVVTKYDISPPGTMLVCGGKDSPQGIQPTGETTLEYLLPHDPGITTVQFMRGKEVVQRFDLGAIWTQDKP